MASPVPIPVVPPPPTTDIMDGAGNKLGALPISAQDKTQLAAGKKIILTFHTPRMFRQTIPERNFSLALTQDQLGNINGDPTQVALAVAHLAEIASAQALSVVIQPGTVEITI